MVVNNGLSPKVLVKVVGAQIFGGDAVQEKLPHSNFTLFTNTYCFLKSPDRAIDSTFQRNLGNGK